MATIETICQTGSALSDVQIRILQNSEELLQFSSDLSHREVFVYVPGKQDDMMILAAHRQPFSRRRQGEPQKTTAGAQVTVYDEPLVWRVFQTGNPLRGAKETYYGRTEPIQCYPFVDNGGLTIGVVSFVGNVEKGRDLLTETAFLALQVPLTEHSDQLYKNLSLQDGIILVNGNGVILYADEMAESIMRLRGTVRELTGETIYNSEINLSGVKHAIETRQGSVGDVRHSQNIFTRRIIPILRRGHIDRIIAIITERTELRQKEEELMVKTSVIKEIHHRVKNNLQTIAGLLRMQMRRVQSQEAKDALNESLNRIVSISLVHETLSRHDEEIIDVSEIAERLLFLVLHSLSGSESRIVPSFHGEKMMLPSAAATSLALVLNELITNAVLHGFAGRSEGHLQVTLSRQGDQALIVVRDDGCGMAVQQEKEGRKHLGLQIVHTLVEKDLQGTVVFAPNNPEGTEVTICFPLTKGGN